MTDQEWEAQNRGPHPGLTPAELTARGICWHCSGNGVNYTAFGGVQRAVPCREKCDNGKAKR
jgi:hypothetical protein